MSLFPEWQAEHANDPPPLPKKIRAMHARYGRQEDRKCGECAHLKVKHEDKTYFKCRLFGDTNGPGTDWRKKWPACGKFQEST